MTKEFTMSMYGSKEALLEAKCKWLEEQIQWIQDSLHSLNIPVYGSKFVMEYYTNEGFIESVEGKSLLKCIDKAQQREEA